MNIDQLAAYEWSMAVEHKERPWDMGVTQDPMIVDFEVISEQQARAGAVMAAMTNSHEWQRAVWDIRGLAPGFYTWRTY
jgi:hypothetical protein